MESTQRICATKGCQRQPQAGWAFCPDCADKWLDRVLCVERESDYLYGDLPRYQPDEAELRVLDGNR